MTSQDRHEIRYQRRKAKREAKRVANAKTFDEVFTFENLWKAGKTCCTDVRWKTSTINFEFRLLTYIESLYEQFLQEKYHFNGFKYFRTIEHGKMRDINSLIIHDRTIQKCYCDYMMTEAYSRTFIFDNSASLPDKGMDMTLNRLKENLRHHYRKHGLQGGIYQFDFHGYFASIPHDRAKERLKRHVLDPKLYKIGCQLIDDFTHLGGIEHDLKHPHGVGLGSQVSQNIALDYASPVDHYVKDALRKKGYARYMDDGYIISDSLKELYEIRAFLIEFVKLFGLEMNEKKNVITPFKDHSFYFLKMRIRLQEKGKVTMKLSRNSIRSMRRKLVIFRKWCDGGKMSADDIFKSYQSWRSHAHRCDSYKTVHAMDLYFIRLFQKELAEWDKYFKCTLRAKWNDEIGWIYYTSNREYKSKIDELNRTWYERRMNGFVPLVDRWDWYSKQRSKSAQAFDYLRSLQKDFYKEDD